MTNTGKVWNVSTEEKDPILSAKRNKHTFFTSFLSFTFTFKILLHHAVWYPQTSYFSFFSEWMLQNQPGKSKRIKQLSQSLQNTHTPGDLLLASLESSAFRSCSVLVWMQLCTTAPQLRKRCIRHSQLLRCHWNLTGNILQGSPIYTASIMYLRC